jgi:hypothetical protein
MKKMSLIAALLLLLFVTVNAQISLNRISTYNTGLFEVGAAEIVAYDKINKKLFYVNGNSTSIDEISILNPETPIFQSSISLLAYGNGVNSVAVFDTLLVAAVEGATPQDSGKVVIFNTNGVFLKQLTVGALPDMITFTNNGQKILTANEGEPDATNPEGSVSVINISGGINNLSQANVTNIGFSSFNGSQIAGLRIESGVSVAQDLEPEYIAVSSDNSTAYVTLQENNAVAVINLTNNTVTAIYPLGYKNHNLAGMGLDPSDRDNSIKIETHPVLGMYMPDAIACYTVGGNTYYVTANEGDDRGENVRVKTITLDSTLFPDASFLQRDSVLGRLGVSSRDGDFDNDGDYDSLFTYGSRSFTIWNASNGSRVYDSGDDFEQIVATQLPAYFGSDNVDNNSFDSRSDNKGPEPEAVEIANIGSSFYAFIGLERIGGIMVYDITNPASPQFIEYVNNRNFSAVASDSAAGDLGVEDILYIKNTDSPDGKYYVVTANEISGTVSIFEITGIAPSSLTIKEDHLISAQINPNPVQDILNIDIREFSKADADASFRVFDMQGRLLLESKENISKNSKISLNATTLSKGVYTLIISIDGKNQAIPFVK